jgi:hypothetical protein
MSRARLLVAASGAALMTGVLVACTLTQSLDYLQKGPGPADATADARGVEAATEAGLRMPAVLVPNQIRPGFLAQDGAALYWIAGGMVMSVPKAGGTPKPLGAVPPSARALVAEPDPAGALFVVVGDTVLRIPKDGTDAGVVFAVGAGEPPADTIAASASSLYVLQYDQSLVIEGSRILRMAKDGGGVIDIAPDSGPSTLNVDPRSVFWLGSDPDRPTLVEQLESAPPGTTTAVYSFGPNDDLPALSADIAIDDASFYWTTSAATSGAAEIVARKREAVASVIAVYRGAPEDTFANIAIDATHVYFIETRTSSLLRVAKTGGPAETLLAGLEAPSGLVVDASAIYLTVEATGSTGKVLVLAK